MPRKDYEQFIRGFNFNNKQYQVYSADNASNYPWSFAKVYDMNTIMYEPDINGYKFHVFVDLYVYDGVPKDEKEFISFQKRMLRLNALHANQVGSYKPRGSNVRVCLVRLSRFILKLFPEGYFWKRITKMRKKYNNNCESIVCYSCHDKATKKVTMINTKEVLFENRKYPIPEGYHEHLLGCYNHPYYEYPPKEEQVNKHHFIAFID